MKLFQLAHIKCGDCSFQDTVVLGKDKINWHECNQGNRAFLIPNAKTIKLKEKKHALCTRVG